MDHRQYQQGMESGRAPALPALWAERLVRDGADLAPGLSDGTHGTYLEWAGLGVSELRDVDHDLGFTRVAG